MPREKAIAPDVARHTLMKIVDHKRRQPNPQKKFTAFVSMVTGASACSNESFRTDSSVVAVCVA